MNTHPLIWMAVLFATAVPGFIPKARMQAKGFSSLPAEDKTVRNPDPRVERALKKLGLKYEVDEDGDFKLVFAVEDNRTQVVIISSTTETLGKMEIREVWSPIAKFASTPPCDLSLDLLEKHGTFKIGSYQYKKLRSGSYLLVFIVHLSAEAPAEELGSIVRAVAITADETEKEIMESDDY
jgi:hypothetical protein